MTVKFGLAEFGFPTTRPGRAPEVEKAGFDSIWVSDHFRERYKWNLN